MSNYMVNLPQPEIRNALMDFSGLNSGLDSIRDQNNANRNALMQQSQLDMRKEEQTYQRGRDQKQDAWQQVQRAGQMADAIARMPDNDPAKPAAWQKYIQSYGDGDHGPEELDFRTGPKIAAAAAGKFLDPRDDRMKDLELQKTQAEIGKLNRAGADEWAQFGKTGTVVQGPDGRHYSVRYSADGTERINPIDLNGQNMSPAKGVDIVGNLMFNKATGADVRDVGPAIAAGEQKKVEGRETGERVMGTPKAQASLESANAKTQLVRSKIAQALPMVNNYTAGMGSLLSTLPGTQARDLKEKIDTIIANLGFEELQDMRNNSPTGGALGAIAVQELAMLQKTKASLEQAQTVGQLQSALRELDQLQSGASERRQRAFASTYANPQAGAPQAGDPLAEARAAIAAGADPAKVMQRLQQNGIDPRGLR